MRKFKIKWKITLLAFSMVFLTTTLLSIYVYWTINTNAQEDIETFEQQIIDIKKKDLKSVSNIVFTSFDQASKALASKTQEKLKANLETISAMIETRYEKALKSSNPGSAMIRAKKELLEIFNHMRFNTDGYIWIHSLDPQHIDKPRMIMHPFFENFNGKDISKFKYTTGENIGDIIFATDIKDSVPFFVQMNRLVAKDSIGFVSYQWPKPGLTKYQPKTSCVKLFAPWGWVIGTGAYIKDIEPYIKKEVLKEIKHFRYGYKKQDYFWIHSYNPSNPEDVKMIMHPILPELDGQDMSEYKFTKGDKKGEIVYAQGLKEKVPFMVQMNREISQGREGVVRYEWPKPTADGLSSYQPKLSFIKRFEKWNWVIGTGVYLDEVEAMQEAKREDVAKQTSSILLVLSLVSIGILIVSFIAIFSLSNAMVTPIQTLVKRMKEYSQGDIALSELPKTNDEIGDISSAFKDLRLENINLFNELQKRVERRTQELEEAKALSGMKSQFINMISHEYKTPLTVISTSTMLIDTLTKESGKNIKKHTGKINTAIKVLTQLIDNVFAFSGSDQFDINYVPSPVNLAKLCNEVFEEVKVIDSTKHVFNYYQFSDSINIMSDSRFLRQIITQLLKNAIKFSPPETPVELRVEEQNGNIMIKVIDKGIGISKEDQDQIFIPFFKNEDTIGLKSGVGLGLAIVKRYVDALKGNISVESKLNSGSTFTIILPKQ